MSKEEISGWIFLVLGIAGGAVIGAYLLLHPDAANTIFYSALAICGICIVAGTCVAGWPLSRGKRMAKDHEKANLPTAIGIEGKPGTLIVENCYANGLGSFIKSKEIGEATISRNDVTANTFLESERIDILTAEDNKFKSTNTTPKDRQSGKQYRGWRPEPSDD